MNTSAVTPPSPKPSETYELVRLGYVARLQNGLTVDAKRDVTGDVVTSPYLRVANVQAGSLDLESVTEITVPRSVARRSTLRPGDVLMTEGGDLDKLGRGTVWQGELDRCLHQNHIFAVRPDPQRLSGRFLAYVTQSLYGRHYFESTGTRTTNLASTNSSKIQSFPLPLPPLDEQRRIADFLDAETARIDTLLEKRRRQHALLEERHLAALADCVSARGAGSYVHPLAGTVSDQWQVVQLRRVLPAINVGVVINPSTYFTDIGVPFIHGFNVRSGWIDKNGMKYMSEASNEELSRSRLDAGDVLVVRVGAPGRSAVVTDEFHGANCASILILRKGQRVLPEFLSAFMNSPAGRGQVKISQYGAAQEVISAGQALSFEIPVPSIPEQRRRISKLDQAVESIDLLCQRINSQVALLAERRQALITAAVTGQFDVSTASGRNVTDGVNA